MAEVTGETYEKSFDEAESRLNDFTGF